MCCVVISHQDYRLHSLPHLCSPPVFLSSHSSCTLHPFATVVGSMSSQDTLDKQGHFWHFPDLTQVT